VAGGTRYFGGIKLGTGGLVRAYSQCLREALKSLSVQECLLHHVVRFEVDYALYGALRHHLPSFGVYVEDTLFGAQVALTLAVPFDRAEALEAMLREMTNGAVILQACTIGERYAAPLLGE
ncbi:MAG: YigZ family protein, partial [Chloroflexi bacterium]|nr:YigZ family protein [Chloroflexota bacterium]